MEKFKVHVNRNLIDDELVKADFFVNINGKVYEWTEHEWSPTLEAESSETKMTEGEILAAYATGINSRSYLAPRIYFGFAVADGMFVGDVNISRKVVNIEQAKALLTSDVIPCLNPSHIATISAMRSRFGIDVSIPEKAPNVVLNPGDTLIVMSVRGLPRLDATRHEYTAEEIAKADFVFSAYKVGCK